MQNEQRNTERMRGMKTEALQHIVDHGSDQERAEPGDPRYPLAGRVHISGIGHVPFRQIERELENRRNQAA